MNARLTCTICLRQTTRAITDGPDALTSYHKCFVCEDYTARALPLTASGHVPGSGLRDPHTPDLTPPKRFSK